MRVDAFHHARVSARFKIDEMKKQTDLFDRSEAQNPDPASSHKLPTVKQPSTALVITTARLGPEQKLFNQLLEKIEVASAKIAELNRLTEAYRPERIAKITPLFDKSRIWDEKLVIFLENRLQTPKGLTANQRDNLADIVMHIGQSVLNTGLASEELELALERLYNEFFKNDDDAAFDEHGFNQHEHSEQDFSDLQKRMADAFGVDLDGEDGFDSPEAMFAAAMKNRHAEQDAWIQAQEARRANRKKSTKEKQAEQEQLDADAALRLIYRKLASALHPDREPDEAERKRKTQLMAQVNLANDNKDLLALLKLQLEIEQIQPEAIAEMADNKLRHYNRVLKEQFKTLQHEQQHLMQRVRDEFNLHYGAITAQTIESALRAELVNLGQQADLRQREFNEVQTDKPLKAWLKNQMMMMKNALAWNEYY
jgi:phage gp37-like protein